MSRKQFKAHFLGVLLSLENLLDLKFTPKPGDEIHGAICYVCSFTCITMSAVWHRILVPFDHRYKVTEASDATSGMEIANTESLLAQLVVLQDS